MRTFMLALVGLLSLTGAIPLYDISKTEAVARHYEETWHGNDAEKKRCSNSLRALAGNDIHVALQSGASIDESMRKAKCLDVYSYVYGSDVLPVGHAVAKMDGPAVDLVGGYAFVYINTFQNNGEELLKKLRALTPKALKDIETVVIDVRGNEGGYVETLRNLLDLSFSPQPGLEYLKLVGRATFGTHYTTSRTGIFAGRSILILADSDTGSSSEWLIETLCYEWYPDKCTTVGAKTLGKSILQCMQTVYIHMKLTCGEWYLTVRGDTRKDQSRLPVRIQGVGIPPDKPMTFDCDRFAYACIARQLADAGL